MSSKIGLKVLAGAVALAVSSGAFAANTTSDENGTIILNINDSLTNESYVFDTGLTISSFTGTTNESFNLSSDANYKSFFSALPTTNGLQYSVEGAINPTTTSTYVADFSTAGSAVTEPGSSVSGETGAVGIYLVGAQVPAGGSVFYSSAADPSKSWVKSGNESTLTSNAGVNDAGTVGNPLAFYQSTTTKPNGNKSGSGSLTQFAGGSWLLSSTGTLTYTVAGSTTPPTVPLPAPLMLLVSGLGLMGVVARRRQSVAV